MSRTTDHESRKHAPLPPSASSRWLNCLPSQGYIRQLIAAKVIKKRTSGESAKRGTRIHEIAEPWLKATLDGKKYAPPKTADKDEVAVARRYVQHCVSLRDDALLIDENVQWGVESKSVVTDECWGSCDFWLYVLNRFISIDLKSGHEEVDPRDNTQLGIYALGIIRQKRFVCKEVELAVWQPTGDDNISPLRSYLYTMKDFTAFVAGINAGIKKATSYLAPDVKERLIRANLKAGAWCEWCDALGVCPTADERAREISSNKFMPVPIEKTKVPDPKTLKAGQVAEILSRAKMFIAWLDAVAVRALELAQKGETIAGHKVVAKQTRRAWKKEIKPAVIARKLGLNPKELFKQVMLSPAQVEELLDASGKSKLESLVFKPIGEPVVVPDTDRRIAIPSTKISFTPVSHSEEEDG